MTESSPATRRGRPRKQDSDHRRQIIIEASRRAFIELGFAHTTTTEIARRAKISKRTLYEVFSDKKSLFAAVIYEQHHLLIDLPRPKDEHCSLEETLFRIFRLDGNETENQAREALLRLMTRESILFPELADYLYKSETVRSREMLIEWLEEEHQRGRIEFEDIDVCAGMLMDIVFGALLPHRPIHNAEDRRKQINHIKQRIKIMLRGLEK